MEARQAGSALPQLPRQRRDELHHRRVKIGVRGAAVDVLPREGQTRAHDHRESRRVKPLILALCAQLLALAALEVGVEHEPVRIEPFEQPWLERLGARVLRERVELCPTGIFAALEANDILFIDSSHIIRPQGDVVHEILYLFGMLQPGALIHVHDIFTPRDYPPDYILRDRWLWNEQYLLEGFLSFNDSFEVLAAVNWLSHNHRDRLLEACPVLLEQPESEPRSFWLRRVR